MRPYRPRGVGPAIRPDGTLRPDTYRDDSETGCRIWLKSMRTVEESRNGGTPQAWNGHKVVQVRNELWRIHRGTPLAIGAGAKCGAAHCVALDHLFDGRTMGTLTIDQQHRIDELAGKLSMRLIAEQIGTTRIVVEGYLGKRQPLPHGAMHEAARRYAGKPIPARPPGIRDRSWTIFVYACDHTYKATGQEFRQSTQAVQQLVTAVLARMDAADGTENVNHDGDAKA